MVTAKKRTAADREHAKLIEQRDVAVSQRDSLLASLKAVLATIPHEFAKPEAQAIRMAARALLEEVGGG